MTTSVYPDIMFGAKPMRNRVKVLDPSIPRLTIFQLQPGEMFSYTDRKGEGFIDGVYMKVDGMGKGNAAIYLSTGMYYTINEDASIRRVSLVEIGTQI